MIYPFLMRMCEEGVFMDISSQDSNQMFQKTKLYYGNLYRTKAKNDKENKSPCKWVENKVFPVEQIRRHEAIKNHGAGIELLMTRPISDRPFELLEPSVGALHNGYDCTWFQFQVDEDESQVASRAWVNNCSVVTRNLRLPTSEQKICAKRLGVKYWDCNKHGVYIARTPIIAHILLGRLSVSSWQDVTPDMLAELKGHLPFFVRILSLKAHDFDGLSGISFLNLSCNRLEAFPQKLFKGLLGLKKLDLSRNDLMMIPPENVFDNNPLLERLDLSHNILSFLDGNSLPTHLTHLTLANNSLHVLSKEVLESLSTLVYLDLSFNHFVSLPSEMLNVLVNLVELDVSSNRLLCVSRDQGLGESSTLKRLDLSNNLLAFLSASELGVFPNLTTLDVSNNELTRLDEDFSQFFKDSRYHSEVNFSGNKLSISLDVLQTMWHKSSKSMRFYYGNDSTENEVSVALAKDAVLFSLLLPFFDFGKTDDGFSYLLPSTFKQPVDMSNLLDFQKEFCFSFQFSEKDSLGTLEENSESTVRSVSVSQTVPSRKKFSVVKKSKSGYALDIQQMIDEGWKEFHRLHIDSVEQKVTTLMRIAGLEASLKNHKNLKQVIIKAQSIAHDQPRLESIIDAKVSRIRTRYGI